MARISLTPRPSLSNRLFGWVSRRVNKAELDPVAAVAHNERVMWSYGFFELGVRRWRALDPQLKVLAVMGSAHRIGCSWCTDFGYWSAHAEGMPVELLEAVPRWRESDVFTPTQRRVLEFAELVSGEVQDVPDGLVAHLREELGEPALVELAMMVAVENQRSRFNSALGLTSQGFKAQCELPARSGAR